MTAHRPRKLSGKQVRALREAFKLTQAEAARRVGISQPVQSRIERLGDRDVAEGYPIVAHIYTCSSCRAHFLFDATLDPP